MEYKGRLYAKMGGKYCPLDQTTEDWDKLESQLTTLQAENKKMKDGLREILKGLELACIYPIMQTMIKGLLNYTEGTPPKRPDNREAKGE